VVCYQEVLTWWRWCGSGLIKILTLLVLSLIIEGPRHRPIKVTPPCLC
jgi:hypothetical protein